MIVWWEGQENDKKPEFLGNYACVYTYIYIYTYTATQWFNCILQYTVYDYAYVYIYIHLTKPNPNKRSGIELNPRFMGKTSGLSSKPRVCLTLLLWGHLGAHGCRFSVWFIVGDWPWALVKQISGFGHESWVSRTCRKVRMHETLAIRGLPPRSATQGNCTFFRIFGNNSSCMAVNYVSRPSVWVWHGFRAGPSHSQQSNWIMEVWHLHVWHL